MAIFKPDTKIDKRHFQKPLSIFLAGTIDNGESEDWQKEVTEVLKPNYDILNPRRDNWNPLLRQDISNPEFVQQVNWELDALETADRILMNILPDSKSPITLLELGLFARSGKLVVVCPDQFYRKGNVEITCDRYHVLLFKTLKAALVWL